MYIKEPVTNTIVIEKSKFITYLKPCFNDDEYKNFLKETRKAHFDASHVCSGFISGSIKRSSDDGEPAGTAGMPILSALEKSGIDHTACLVVRYFGGIKLGAGGLLRAYGESCSSALKLAKYVEDVEYNKYELVLNYELANKVKYILEKEAVNLNTVYDEQVRFIFLSIDTKLLDKIAEITSGIVPTLLKKEVIQKEV